MDIYRGAHVLLHLGAAGYGAEGSERNCSQPVKHVNPMMFKNSWQREKC